MIGNPRTMVIVNGPLSAGLIYSLWSFFSDVPAELNGWCQDCTGSGAHAAFDGVKSVGTIAAGVTAATFLSMSTAMFGVMFGSQSTRACVYVFMPRSRGRGFRCRSTSISATSFWHSYCVWDTQFSSFALVITNFTFNIVGAGVFQQPTGQNVSRIASCNSRSPLALRICPKFTLFTLLVGLPQRGVFVRLYASPRSSNLYLSANRKFLISDKS